MAFAEKEGKLAMGLCLGSRFTVEGVFDLGELI